ncbi:MAG TPA: serine hydrolase, partial [Acidobacteriota bacterium]|nr:serine hydrolase [Acidobacteriota bacterium]
ANWELNLQQVTVLSKKLQEMMHQPTLLNDGFPYPYGFGWETDTVNAVARVRHGGSLGGFRTEFMRFPGEKLAVIVLTNQDSANPMKIASLVANTVLPNLKYRPIKDTDPAFSATVKKLLESWADGTVDSSIFTPGCWKVFEPRFKNPNAIKGFKNLGPMTGLSLVESRQTGDFRVTRHRITFASQTQLIQIVRTKAGLITDMRLENE